MNLENEKIITDYVANNNKRTGDFLISILGKFRTVELVEWRIDERIVVLEQVMQR